MGVGANECGRVAGERAEGRGDGETGSRIAVACFHGTKSAGGISMEVGRAAVLARKEVRRQYLCNKSSARTVFAGNFRWVEAGTHF